MPFNTKQTADYAEMINELLDKIRMEKEIDFDNAIIDFNKILNANDAPIDFHPDLKGRMDFVYEALIDPAMYGIQPNDAAEYQQLIKKHVKAKIKEFNEFTPEKKIQYIENQQRLREQATVHHERMAAAEPRRTADAHRMQTEGEALVAEQRRIEELIQQQRRVSTNTVTQQDNAEEQDRLRHIQTINHLQLLATMLNTNPENIPARAQRARLISQINPGEALSDYNFILHRHPEDIEALLERVSIYERTGRFDDAIQDYHYIVQNYPAYREEGQNAIERLSQQTRTETQFDYTDLIANMQQYAHAASNLTRLEHGGGLSATFARDVQDRGGNMQFVHGHSIDAPQRYTNINEEVRRGSDIRHVQEGEHSTERSDADVVARALNPYLYWRTDNLHQMPQRFAPREQTAIPTPIVPEAQVLPTRTYDFSVLLNTLQQYTETFGAQDPAQAAHVWGNVVRVVQEAPALDFEEIPRRTTEYRDALRQMANPSGQEPAQQQENGTEDLDNDDNNSPRSG